MGLLGKLSSICLGLLISSVAMAATTIEQARLWQTADNTRLVFDLSGPVQYEVLRLSNPERLVIDVRNAQQQANLTTLALTGSAVQQVRSGIRNKKDVRLVLDLAKAVEPKIFALKPSAAQGHRLVVDLPYLISTPVAVAASQHQASLKAELQAQEEQLIRKQLNISPAPVPSIKPVAVAPAPVIYKPAPVLPPQKGLREVIIAIDAGHGGEDPGAIGPKGIREKDVVLAIAKELFQLVGKQYGMHPILVRQGDYFIPLKKRREYARQQQADLFVSVHADAARNRSAQGSSVYALSERGATSETARLLAQKENDADLVGGISLDIQDNVLREVLLDLSMTASLAASLEVGQQVLGSLGKINSLHSRRVEQAGFMVLKSPDVPSILVETGYISNPTESQRLNSRSHQQSVAKAILQGVTAYFDHHPPPGTYLAWKKQNQQSMTKRSQQKSDTQSYSLATAE